MASNFCINNSLTGMQYAYNLFGTRITNTIIERSAGSIFTGGVTLDDLKKDAKVLRQRNIGILGGYCVEDVDTSKESELVKFTDTILETIEGLTEQNEEGHFAIKFTAFIGIDDLRKLNTAQERFIAEVLQVEYDVEKADDEITTDQIGKNLRKLGIDDYLR